METTKFIYRAGFRHEWFPTSGLKEKNELLIHSGEIESVSFFGEGMNLLKVITIQSIFHLLARSKFRFEIVDYFVDLKSNSALVSIKCHNLLKSLC